MSKKTIWDSYDFKSLDKSLKEPTKNQASQFLKDCDAIINEEIINILGETNYIKSEFSEGNHRIYLITKDRQHIHDFNFKGDNYILEGFNFQSLDVFREYVRQVISKKCVASIKEAYKYGSLKTLPDSIKLEYTTDLSKLTTEWLSSTFDDIAEDCGNSETIESVKMVSTKDGVEFTFDVDCNRYGLHRNQSISISNRGNIKIDFYDTPIEGGDVEGELKRKIDKLIKVKN